MTFISSDEIEKSLREHGMVATLKTHGRKRIAPGFTVADYVKIGEFYAHAKHPKRGELAYWDSVSNLGRKPAVAS